MTPRQRAAAAGELTYFGGATCKYGHNGARYTSTGDCLECRKRPDTAATPAPQDYRLRDLTVRLHEVRADERKASSRVKAAVRQFEAETNDIKKWRASEAVAREHRALEDLRREAAALELDVEAMGPAPNPGRLASLLAAAGASPTPPPVRFELRPASDTDIQAKRSANCSDPDLVFHRAQEANTKLVRETARARLMAEYPGGTWGLEDSMRVVAQVRADLTLAPLPVVEPEPHVDEDEEERQARIDREVRRARLLSTGS